MPLLELHLPCFSIPPELGWLLTDKSLSFGAALRADVPLLDVNAALGSRDLEPAKHKSCLTANLIISLYEFIRAQSDCLVSPT